MKHSVMTGRPMWPRVPQALIAAGLLALACLLPSTSSAAEASELSKESVACLKCHDKPGMEKALENGEKLSLHVSTQEYADSMHNETNCEDCHADLDAKTHGKVKTAIKSKRDFAHSMRETCRDCHKKKFTQYDDSVHAALVKDGSKKAQLCADCHNPHTQRSVKIAEPISATPCAACHEAIFKASTTDVHGLARAAKGKDAPLCAGCHKAHEVKAASLGEGAKDSCLACHKDAVDQHKGWLPNTGLHFEAISCPACHAPAAHRRVNLRLYDGPAAAKKQISEKRGVPQFVESARAADANNLGLDERALLSLLKEFNQDGDNSKAVLRGRLEVRTGVEAHQLSDKSKAIKDCDTCHRAGAEAFQSVSLTIAGADGRPLRHGVQKEVLTSLQSMESVRGFYAIGSTRIKLLDTLLILVVLGSIGGPLAHMTTKWLFKRFREKQAAEQRAAELLAASQAAAAVPGNRDDVPN